MPMNSEQQQQFFDALAERKTWVLDYLAQDRRKTLFVPEDIHDAVYSYVMAGGKVLRPCVLYFACGNREDAEVGIATAVFDKGDLCSVG